MPPIVFLVFAVPSAARASSTDRSTSRDDWVTTVFNYIGAIDILVLRPSFNTGSIDGGLVLGQAHGWGYSEETAFTGVPPFPHYVGPPSPCIIKTKDGRAHPSSFGPSGRNTDHFLHHVWCSTPYTIWLRIIVGSMGGQRCTHRTLRRTV